MSALNSMQRRPAATTRVAAAVSAAILADILQLPATLALFSGIFAVEGLAIDWLIDLFMAGLTTGLLGFHWALLPTCMIEAVPVIDAAPTWTGCVLFVAWRRRGQLVSGEKGF